MEEISKSDQLAGSKFWLKNEKDEINKHAQQSQAAYFQREQVVDMDNNNYSIQPAN